MADHRVDASVPPRLGQASRALLVSVGGWLAASVQRPKGPAAWLVVLAFAATLVLWIAGITASFDPPYLTLALNFVFIGIASVPIALMGIRAFLRSGSWPVLFLGAGALAFGLATVAGSWALAAAGPNPAITIHNSTALLAALLHAFGAFFLANGIAPHGRPARRPSTVVQVYLGSLAAILFVILAGLQGLMPPFFVEGAGGTPFRQTVVALASLLFFGSGLVFLTEYGRNRAAFHYWYALGLLLTALGMAAVLMQTATGTPLNWTGRIAQLLSGVYLLMAALITVQEARARNLRPSDLLASFFWRDEVLTGINRILRLAITAENEEELGVGCLAVAEELTQSECGFVGTTDEQTGRLDGIAVSNPGSEACQMTDPSHPARRVAGGFVIHGLYGRVLLDGKGFFTNDPASHPDRIGTPPGHPPLTAFLGVPLANGGKTIGMVGLGNRPGGYSPQVLEVIEALAPSIAQAILFKRASDALRRAHGELEQRVKERTAELTLANEALSEREVALRASREQMQELSHRLIEAVEEERHHIALELHDQANQLLTSLMLGLGILEKRYASSEEACRHIAYLQGIGDSLSKCMHDLAVSLRPASLDRLGLVPALNQLTDMFQSNAQVQIDLVTAGLHERLGLNLETAIYRIVQESLTNVVRHAQATHAGVIVQRMNGRVSVIVEDDGKGFELDWAQCSGRLGLTGMRERAEMLGGTFSVETGPGKGTTVFAEMPAKS